MKQRSKEQSDLPKRFFKETQGRWILPPFNFPEFPVYCKHLEKSLLTLCSSHYSSTTDILVVTALSCNETALLCWQTSSLWVTHNIYWEGYMADLFSVAQSVASCKPHLCIFQYFPSVGRDKSIPFHPLRCLVFSLQLEKRSEKFSGWKTVIV